MQIKCFAEEDPLVPIWTWWSNLNLDLVDLVDLADLVDLVDLVDLMEDSF